MHCLLDKVTVRYAVQGLFRLAEGQSLTGKELFTLDLFSRAQPQGIRLFINPPAANVLQSLARLPRYSALVHLALDRVEIAHPARYFKRWSRRLRDLEFTREDAALLALATFGTDEKAAILGMHVVATFDRPMINNWSARLAVIQEHLSVMRNDLPAPYCCAFVPQLVRPDQVGF